MGVRKGTDSKQTVVVAWTQLDCLQAGVGKGRRRDNVGSDMMLLLRKDIIVISMFLTGPTKHGIKPQLF